jgi:hypothetical protein
VLSTFDPNVDAGGEVTMTVHELVFFVAITDRIFRYGDAQLISPPVSFLTPIPATAGDTTQWMANKKVPRNNTQRQPTHQDGHRLPPVEWVAENVANRIAVLRD